MTFRPSVMHLTQGAFGAMLVLAPLLISAPAFAAGSDATEALHYLGADRPFLLAAVQAVISRCRDR